MLRWPSLPLREDIDRGGLVREGPRSHKGESWGSESPVLPPLSRDSPKRIGETDSERDGDSLPWEWAPTKGCEGDAARIGDAALKDEVAKNGEGGLRRRMGAIS